MSNVNYPKPTSHNTFQLGAYTIDSHFDSGNCCNAEKAGPNHFNVWIGTDHPKNNYRTWFHFSISGVEKGTTLTFTVKNMQNQSRLLNQGLVPVCRVEGTSAWSRISQKVNTAGIEYNDGWIEWTFKHRVQESQKHYFAFFYPWSNDDNNRFLSQVQQNIKSIPDIYFYRGNIIRTLEGRPVEFIVISSNKFKNNKEDKIDDKNLFNNESGPRSFGPEKPGIVISARVHPGEVPGSHVMTGIIKTLTEPEGLGRSLRDEFVFYIFPILNPDGVGRGHYRVDTNGINLNRCYLSPSPKQHPSIYSIKKIIMHLHEQGKFFAFLDLHAHAARKGTFIYGNYSKELMKQTDACLFPRLLSMNSKDFEYEGSNFTEKNMNCKDRGDHMSKQGSGRVAMFRATKNVACWTLQCNYNISKVLNVLEDRKLPQDANIQLTEDNLQADLIIDWKAPKQVPATEFFTIQTYRTLGKQICETFLDLVEKNQHSRINNPKNIFKSVKYVKLSLALSLLRMAPNRFQSMYKRVFFGITNSESAEINSNSLKALYFLMIKDAKIPNINGFIKAGDMSLVILPDEKKKPMKPAYRTRYQRIVKPKAEETEKEELLEEDSKKIQGENRTGKKCANQILQILKEQEDRKQKIHDQLKIRSFHTVSASEKRCNIPTKAQIEEEEAQKIKEQAGHNFVAKKVCHFQKQGSLNKVSLRIDEFKMIGIQSMRRSMGQKIREMQQPPLQNYSLSSKGVMVSTEYRSIAQVKGKSRQIGTKYRQELTRIKLNRKGNSAKDAVICLE